MRGFLIRALVPGLLITLLQVAMAVWWLAPEGPALTRFHTLIQHDSHWFANIIDRGYQTTLPPTPRKLMEVSNVAFFPAYPLLAGGVGNLFGLSTYTALLVTAQAAAWGFWTYFFLIAGRWGVSSPAQGAAALAVAVHPTAFFMIAGYSESLFLMALLGFIYWSTANGRAAKIVAALHGAVMSATRIVGLPCALFPLVHRLGREGRAGLVQPRTWWSRYGGAAVLSAVSMLGGAAFLLYCFVRFGRWDLYMLTQEAGWQIFPDYLALFKPSSYRWEPASIHHPTGMSQLTVTLGAVVFLAVFATEAVTALRRRTAWPARLGLYFCGLTTFYIAVSGVASVHMESMLRYQFCAHALIVLALLHFFSHVRTPSLPVRVSGLAALALLGAASLGLQAWFVWNFTRGHWIA